MSRHVATSQAGGSECVYDAVTATSHCAKQHTSYWRAECMFSRYTKSACIFPAKSERHRKLNAPSYFNAERVNRISLKSDGTQALSPGPRDVRASTPFPGQQISPNAAELLCESSYCFTGRAGAGIGPGSGWMEENREKTRMPRWRCGARLKRLYLAETQANRPGNTSEPEPISGSLRHHHELSMCGPLGDTYSPRIEAGLKMQSFQVEGRETRNGIVGSQLWAMSAAAVEVRKTHLTVSLAKERCTTWLYERGKAKPCGARFSAGPGSSWTTIIEQVRAVQVGPPRAPSAPRSDTNHAAHGLMCTHTHKHRVERSTYQAWWRRGHIEARSTCSVKRGARIQRESYPPAPGSLVGREERTSNLKATRHEADGRPWSALRSEKKKQRGNPRPGEEQRK
ncbi:hypothetical protein GGX14DRAFT_619853 [Mycena pura]|uniref:Uncharacterized protein n=1 Tax=Mycena pura TaxID=153505 RepID=A0AAD6VHI9_9AGAR|nr:hypothetical protein GGX14DRAFT_619853 [Mycena pura]